MHIHIYIYVYVRIYIYVYIYIYILHLHYGVALKFCRSFFIRTPNTPVAALAILGYSSLFQKYPS